MVAFLVFWLLVMSFQDISYCERERYVYVHENDTVTLSCSLDIAVWWGPSNLTTYVSGIELDPRLSKYNRLTFSYNQTTNTSELQIHEFSKEDEGLYRCSYLENGKLESIEETVLIKRDPKNITILGENNTILFAKSNHIVNLTCCVESGIPANETIIWMEEKIELSRGGPSVLTYTFTPNVEDHLLNFSCIVFTGTISLQTHIQLFLYFPPTVLISQGNFLSVLEGSKLNLKCEYTSNSRIKDILWQYDNKTISDASLLHFGSIKREHNGTYSCTVVNQAATVSANVTIEVVYQPDVTISFSNNNGIRQLMCIPNGFPDQYEFSNWEHISEFREHIRYLPPAKSGKLYIPFISMETDRHYDRGVYICSVSNNVSVDGRTFVSAEYWLKSSGKPYFVTSNNAVQYSILGQKSVLTADVRNFEKLIDVALNSNDMTKYNNSKILKSSVIVRDNVYGKHVMVRGTRCIFPINTQTIDDFRQFIVVVNNTIGSSSYVISLRPAEPPMTPQHIRAVAMDNKIIVRWTADLDSGLQKTFFVEYRKHFDQSWSRISVAESSTATINGLEPDTVYLVRVYSKTGAGVSVGTAEIIVKTEKQHYKVQVLSADFAVIIGGIILLMFLCCCGSKVLKNRQNVSRKKNSNSIQKKSSLRIDEISSKHDETSTRLDHYDEITSSYYNPQATRNNTQQEIQKPLNSNRNLETYSVSCRNNTPKTVHQDSPCQENGSSTSSSDESYLAPCRSYVNTDLTNNTKYEGHDRNIVLADIHLLEEMSVASDNSETNMKGILEYETLQLSNTNEHAYNKCNDTEL